MTGKTDDDQCWGCNVVYDGGGFCDDCVMELLEHCVQDDVRFGQLCGGPSSRPAKERREKRMMLWLVPVRSTEISFEQLMGHQAVAYVTKILNTNEAILAESGKRESGAGASGARQHRTHATTLVVKSKQGWLLWETCCLTNTCLVDVTQRCTTCGPLSRRRPKRVSYPRGRRGVQKSDRKHWFHRSISANGAGRQHQALKHNSRLLETRDAPGRESSVRKTATSSV